MRSWTLLISLLSTLAVSQTDVIAPSVRLPSTFSPPPTFKNVNLVRYVNLEKGYAKETINVVIENVSPDAQDEYYVPFSADQMARVGGIEVVNKKDLTPVVVNVVEFDDESATQYIRLKIPKLAPSAKHTLSISYFVLSSLTPLPATIKQNDQQFLVYQLSAYWPSAYVSDQQKTEIKFPNGEIKEYTALKADKQGATVTYGPFAGVAAGESAPIRVRYEFTKPLLHVSRLERDIEVSHWGGNAAFEERYTLHNHAANLTTQFSRLEWASSQYFQPKTTALKELRYPLKVGSISAYFTDVVGNVSTSNFRSTRREASLVLRPRYPVFGGWNYPFRVGWDADLKSFLRVSADTYVLNVPFMEGFKQPEGMEFDDVEVRVILPEGASNVKYHTTMPVDTVTRQTHKTFLDTHGRPTLVFRTHNVGDDLRDREVIVTYEYSFMAALRKPLVVFASVAALFVAGWGVGQLDTSISG